MSEIRDLTLQRNKRDRQFEGDHYVIEAELISVDGAVEVQNKPGFCWARTLTEPANVYPVFNARVSARNGIPVLIRQVPKKPYMWMVDEADYAKIYELQQYSGSPFLPNHGRDHEHPDFKPGADAITFYPRSYSELRTYAGVSGMTISISPHRYKAAGGVLTSFEGLLNVDISSYQPAVGRALWLLVGLNKETNIIEYVEGVDTVDTSAVLPDFPVVPETMEASAYVRLDGSMTTVAEVDIFDVRGLLSTVRFENSFLDQLARVEGEFDIALTMHVVGG